MEEHIPFIYANRVDGLLFINLADDDWTDMGITSRFQRRKLQLILKAFRFRYQKKKLKEDIDEDDELISEYSPSELSDIIAQEDMSDEELAPANLADEEAGDDSDEEAIKETEEQRLERLADEANIHIEMMVPGDNQNFPMIGDIVRIRYTCYLAGKEDKPIGSTKMSLGKPHIEFALGFNQIIKGIDRCIPMMSIGERSKITVIAEYAYGTKGLFPTIAPGASLVYDVTLLGFRLRPKWVKPLVQEPGLNLFPYMDNSTGGKSFGGTGDDEDGDGGS